MLSYVETIKTGGKTPRHFSFAPGGDCLLVANQTDGVIALFRVNGQSGTLQMTDAANVPEAACAQFYVMQFM